MLPYDLPVFPKLPVLIGYYQSLEGIESALTIHFDQSTSNHLQIDALFPWPRVCV